MFCSCILNNTCDRLKYKCNHNSMFLNCNWSENCLCNLLGLPVKLKYFAWFINKYQYIVTPQECKQRCRVIFVCTIYSEGSNEIHLGKIAQTLRQHLWIFLAVRIIFRIFKMIINILYYLKELFLNVFYIWQFY